MPFDPTPLHRLGDRVTVLPPTLPEHGGEPPRRVHVVIEIEDRRPRARQPNGYRFGTVTLLMVLAMIALALFGCTAHAQPTQWQSYREGFVTRHQGQDARGGGAEIASGLLHRCSGGRAGRAVRGLSPAGYCGSSVTAAARLNEAHVQHGNAALINSGDPD